MGNTLSVKENLQIRISVCGVLFSHDDSILIIRDKSSSKWELPGEGIELGETIDEALVNLLKKQV